MRRLLARLLFAGGTAALLGLVVLFLAAQREDAGRSEATIEISLPAEEVFPFVVDLQRRKTWVGWTEVELLSEGDVPQGAQFRVLTGSAEWPVPLFGQVRALQPPRRFEISLRSQDPGFDFEEHAEFLLTDTEPVRVTVRTNAQYGGMWRIVEPLITLAAQRRLEEDVSRLKRLGREASRRAASNDSEDEVFSAHRADGLT